MLYIHISEYIILYIYVCIKYTYINYITYMKRVYGYKFIYKWLNYSTTSYNVLCCWW